MLSRCAGTELSSRDVLQSAGPETDDQVENLELPPLLPAGKQIEPKSSRSPAASDEVSHAESEQSNNSEFDKPMAEQNVPSAAVSRQTGYDLYGWWCFTLKDSTVKVVLIVT